MTCLNPNLVQQQASDPLKSVWVSASAGTGKTKVLVDRLLRLLLPRMMPTGKIRDGTAPDKILCLTFTKAAAAEMANRVNEKLANWSVMNDDDLIKDMTALTGQRPNDKMRDAARRLFAQVVDAPGGMKIMTIHSFCQSVLSRFPLESGLTPGFKIADDRMIAQLMDQARQAIIISDVSDLKIPLGSLITQLDPQSFDALMTHMIAKHGAIKSLINQYGDIEKLITHLYQQFGLDKDDTRNNLITQSKFDEEILKKVAQVLSQGTEKTDHPKAQKIVNWLNADEKARVQNFDNYALAYLTQKGETRANSKLITSALSKKFPDILDVMKEEATRVFDITQKIQALTLLQSTRNVLIVSHALLKHYEALKAEKNCLDYDDQVEKTRDLLSQETMAAWVLFKLDNSIDHILIDEAQDTSPQQWAIVKKITEEFFTGISTRDDDIIRTVFAVGDEKQSIYSFQNADPKGFDMMRGFFENQVKAAKENWRRITMDINFRSAPTILHAVDTLLDDEGMQTSVALRPQQIQHNTFHDKRAGSVEIWPPYELKDSEVGDIFHMPTTRIPQNNPMILLCRHIANTIDHWIKKGKAQPSDILILLQKRRPMMDPLLKTLKNKNIPVAGSDRMLLTEQLVVKDILAAIDFTLLPNDDLTLATLLKSPLIGWSEKQLYDLAINREGSLWNVLNTHKHDTHSYLHKIIEIARTKSAFDFISFILNSPCPTSEKNGRHAFYQRLGLEVKDPIDELLTATQEFQKSNPPGLQGFVHWLTITETEIKRDLSANTSNQVRVMTVHGAKGLQAPIVFMPDTFTTPSAPRGNTEFFWPTNKVQPFLWGTGDATKHAAIQRIKQDNEIAAMDEYRRLLYVAMTRAENKLYIAGWKSKRPSKIEQCWYTLIRNALSDHMEEFDFKDQNLEFDHSALRLESKGSVVDKKTEPIVEIETPVYDWLYRQAPTEPKRPRPLQPSRPVLQDAPVQSPLLREAVGPYWRGSLIHKILQTLPSINEDDREETLKAYLAQPHLDLSQSSQAQLTQEILGVLNHPDFASIFSNQARAEVPLVGEIMIGNTPHAISAQIDRLLIQDNQIWIVDYKTNRPPPKSVTQVPHQYLHQMASYRALMAKIYPSHTINCVLLWTHNPLWMTLPNEMLDKILNGERTDVAA